MQVFLSALDKNRKRPRTRSVECTDQIEELSSAAENRGDCDDDDDDDDDMWSAVHERSDDSSHSRKRARTASNTTPARIGDDYVYQPPVAEVARITTRRKPAASVANGEALGMQRNHFPSDNSSALGDDIRESRCRICNLIMSGTLHKALSLQQRRKSAADDDDDDDAAEYTVHNGIQSLIGLGHVYISSEGWGQAREICAGIAAEWNRMVACDDVGHSVDLDDNLSDIGQKIISDLQRLSDDEADAETRTLHANTEEASEDDMLESLYEGAGGQPLYADESSSSSYAAAADIEGLDDLEPIPDVRISAHELLFHYENCLVSPSREMAKDMRKLSAIQDVLLRRHVVVQAQDEEIGEVSKDRDDDDGDVEEEVDFKSLYAYLSLQQMKCRVAETQLRADSTAMPGGYSVLALRSAMRKPGENALPDGFSKSAGARAGKAGSRNSVGQLGGV